MSQSSSTFRPNDDPVAMFITSMFHSNQYFVHAFDEVCIASREVWFFMTDEERRPFRESDFSYQGANGSNGSTQPFRADADLVLRVAKIVRQREENRKEAAETDALLSGRQANIERSDLNARSVEVAESFETAESFEAAESVADSYDRSEPAQDEIESSSLSTKAVDKEIAKRLDVIEFSCGKARAWRERLERERVRLEDYDVRPMWYHMTTDSVQLSSSASEAGSSRTGSSQTGSSQIESSQARSSRSKLTPTQKRRRRRTNSRALARARSAGAEMPFVVDEWKPVSSGNDRSRSEKREPKKTTKETKIAENCIFKGMTHWSNDMLYNHCNI